MLLWTYLSLCINKTWFVNFLLPFQLSFHRFNHVTQCNSDLNVYFAEPITNYSYEYSVLVVLLEILGIVVMSCWLCLWIQGVTPNFVEYYPFSMLPMFDFLIWWHATWGSCIILFPVSCELQSQLYLPQSKWRHDDAFSY